MKCKLGDYIRIKHGFAFKGEYITAENNGVVLVTPGNFEIGGGFKEDKCKFFNGDYPKEYVLSPYDLIVTMTDLSKQGDTLGYSALVPKTNRVYLHNQRIGLVDVYNPKADKMFIYWLNTELSVSRQVLKIRAVLSAFGHIGIARVEINARLHAVNLMCSAIICHQIFSLGVTCVNALHGNVAFTVINDKGIGRFASVILAVRADIVIAKGRCAAFTFLARPRKGRHRQSCYHHQQAESRRQDTPAFLCKLSFHRLLNRPFLILGIKNPSVFEQREKPDSCSRKEEINRVAAVSSCFAINIKSCDFINSVCAEIFDSMECDIAFKALL